MDLKKKLEEKLEAHFKRKYKNFIKAECEYSKIKLFFKGENYNYPTYFILSFYDRDYGIPYELTENPKLKQYLSSLMVEGISKMKNYRLVLDNIVNKISKDIRLKPIGCRIKIEYEFYSDNLSEKAKYGIYESILFEEQKDANKFCLVGGCGWLYILEIWYDSENIWSICWYGTRSYKDKLKQFLFDIDYGQKLICKIRLSNVYEVIFQTRYIYPNHYTTSDVYSAVKYPIKYIQQELNNAYDFLSTELDKLLKVKTKKKMVFENSDFFISYYTKYKIKNKIVDVSISFERDFNIVDGFGPRMYETSKSILEVKSEDKKFKITEYLWENKKDSYVYPTYMCFPFSLYAYDFDFIYLCAWYYIPLFLTYFERRKKTKRGQGISISRFGSIFSDYIIPPLYYNHKILSRYPFYGLTYFDDGAICLFASESFTNKKDHIVIYSSFDRLINKVEDIEIQGKENNSYFLLFYDTAIYRSKNGKDILIKDICEEWTIPQRWENIGCIIHKAPSKIKLKDIVSISKNLVDTYLKPI